MPIRRALLLYFAVFCSASLTAALRLRALDVSGLSGSGVPGAALLAFVYPLLGAVSEMTLLLGVPASVLCGMAAGMRGRSSALLAGALFAVTFGLSACAEAASKPPGAIAQELVDSGRESCLQTESRRAEVPIVPLTWSCSSGKEATLSGRGAWTSKLDLRAASIEFAADLRGANLQRVEARVAARAPSPALRLSVSRVRVRGLPPWGRPANLSFVFRMLLDGLAAASILGVGIAALRRPEVPRWFIVVVAALSGALVLALDLALDLRSSPPSSYLAAAMAGPTLCGIVLFGWVRLWPRRSFIAQRPS